MKSRNLATASRAGGRPRALRLEDILDQAIGMGLEGVSMPALAEQLGIGTSTLYNYVANREDLVRQAALRRSRHPAFNDVGQAWRDVVRAHAKQSYAIWSSEPQLLDQYMRGGIGPDHLVDYLEGFLNALRRRGFDPDLAYCIYSTVNTVVFGAAMRTYAFKAMADGGLPYGRRMQRVLLEREPDAHPNLRAGTAWLNENPDSLFEAALERIIDSFAAEVEGGD